MLQYTIEVSKLMRHLRPVIVGAARDRIKWHIKWHALQSLTRSLDGNYEVIKSIAAPRTRNTGGDSCRHVYVLRMIGVVRKTGGVCGCG